MNAKTCLTLFGVAALLATQPGAGCVSDTSSTSAGSSSSSSSSNKTTDADRVPARATIVKEGKGILEYAADADGTVWVQDVRDESTIVSRRIHRGEKLRVDPENDRVFLDGDAISKSDIKRDRIHRVYLLKDDRFDRDRRNDRDAHPDLTKVPSGSELIDEGKGRNLSTWARRDGRMYVYDGDAKKVVAAVSVRAGERFVFAPDDDRITVNGERVMNDDFGRFSPKTNYKLYQSR